MPNARGEQCEDEHQTACPDETPHQSDRAEDAEDAGDGGESGQERYTSGARVRWRLRFGDFTRRRGGWLIHDGTPS